MDEYRLIHGSDRSLLLELDKTWDWNMISITINQSKHHNKCTVMMLFTQLNCTVHTAEK